MGPPPGGGPPAPPPRRGASGPAIAALIVGMASVLLAIVPFVGFVGLFAVILAAADLMSGSGSADRPNRVPAIIGMVGGLVGCAAGGLWIYVAATSSCPHVYAYDGQQYRLDADPLSGSFLEAAESTDWDRLEHLAAVDGQYRLRIVNERKEQDYVDAVALLLVDHQPGAEVLPSQAGELFELSRLAPPIACTSTAGRDALAEVSRADDQRYVTARDDLPQPGGPRPEDALVVEFPRPADPRTVLVLRGRGTDFAAEAFAQYLARMGPGLGALMELAQCSESYPYAQRVDDEKRRLGLVLAVDVWDGARWVLATEVEPIGPATLRSQAIPLELPPTDDPTVRLRLRMTPMFCEIDQLELELGPRRQPRAALLRPAAATAAPGRDLTALLATEDGERIRLDRTDAVDVLFDAPPPPVAGTRRTLVLQIRGYYVFDVGGRAWLNPLAILRHRSGEDSLPHFAVRLARELEPAP